MTRLIWILTAALFLAASNSSLADGRQPSPSSVLDKVRFDQKIDAQVPLDLTFRDEAGRPVRLGQFFGERPVVLALVYYRCPMLCTQNLNGLVRSLKPLSQDVGKDFEVVTVSIDPKDTPEIAARKKEGYVGRYGRPGSAGGFHFLTGERGPIDALAEAVGFRYDYSPQTELYSHAAGIIVLTPKGRVARYLFGIDYPPRGLQFALIEASGGKVGSAVAQVLLLCYDYDPASGTYSLVILRVIRALGTLTLLALVTFIVTMLIRDRRRPSGPPPGDLDPMPQATA